MSNIETKSKSRLAAEIDKHAPLLISFIVSLSLLTIFFTFKYFDFRVLNLDKKWIILSGMPVLIGLFIGGYIKSFKGLGVELESKLNVPVPLDFDNEAIVVEKLSLEDKKPENLHKIEQAGPSNVTMLRFINKMTPKYYTADAFAEYIRLLKKLKYILVTKENHEFLFLLPVEKVATPSDQELFILYVEAGSIEQQAVTFANNSIITDYLNVTDTIIEAYRAIDKSWQAHMLEYPALPVLYKNKKIAGVLELCTVAEQIAKEVDKVLT